jgi:hypothetical protein
LNSIVFLQEKVGKVAVLFLSFTKFAVLVGSFKKTIYKNIFFCVWGGLIHYNEWVLLFSVVVVVAWHSR